MLFNSYICFPIILLINIKICICTLITEHWFSMYHSYLFVIYSDILTSRYERRPWSRTLTSWQRHASLAPFCIITTTYCWYTPGSSRSRPLFRPCLTWTRHYHIINFRDELINNNWKRSAYTPITWMKVILCPNFRPCKAFRCDVKRHDGVTKLIFLFI